MRQIERTLGHSGVRIGVVVGGALAAMLAVMAIVRPEMMGMAAIHNLIVGFGL